MQLPWSLRAAAEFEYVGVKPLGDGFFAVPVSQFRGSLDRSFDRGQLNVGAHYLLGSGFTGQTLESLQLPGEPVPTSGS